MRRSELGQTVVEFALTIPLLLIVLVGIFDTARAVWYSNTLAHAVREGTRYAIVHGADSSAPAGPPPLDDSGVRQVVERAAVGVPRVSVVVSWPDGDNARGSRVAVEAVSDFSPTLSDYLMGGGLRVPLRGASQMVIVR